MNIIISCNLTKNVISDVIPKRTQIIDNPTGKKSIKNVHPSLNANLLSK